MIPFNTVTKTYRFEPHATITDAPRTERHSLEHGETLKIAASLCFLIAFSSPFDVYSWTDNGEQTMDNVVAFLFVTVTVSLCFGWFDKSECKIVLRIQFGERNLVGTQWLYESCDIINII